MIYYYVITCLIPNLNFFTISFGDWQNLQWQLVLVWSLGTEVLPDVTPSAPNIIIFLQVTLILALKMPIQSKPREHTMPDNNEEVQREVEERTGTRLCIWQIEVVCMVLDGKDMITAATGSGKSFPYWIPLLYIKYGIIILVTPLKLLGKQFVDILEKNQLCAVSMTAANATNELFEVSNLK